MKSFLVKPAVSLKGKFAVSGDKAIAHRALITGAISSAKTKIKNFPANADCLCTLKALQSLGVKVRRYSSAGLIVFGKGLRGFKKPGRPIFLGDSGTSFRLLLGVLAGQNFPVTLTAGKSLTRRPMRRVTAPLRMMGAAINSRNYKLEEYPPVCIRGGLLQPLTYKMPVASAQVKSAILFAGLYAREITKVIEPIRTRDHTERMLKLFGADIKVKGNTIVIKGDKELFGPREVYIPGDISSASFFMVAAAILPNSKITIKNISLNPSRTGVIKVLKRMGAKIQLSVVSSKLSAGEPMGNITVRSSSLKGVLVRRGEIPSLIDELPILMVAACFAKGKTIFEGVGELRVKETDRIRSMSENLSKMGARISVFRSAKCEDIIITGVKELHGNKVRSFGDHRTAMSMVVAGLKAKGRTLIDDVACINKSFPEFLALLNKLIR